MIFKIKFFLLFGVSFSAIGCSQPNSILMPTPTVATDTLPPAVVRTDEFMPENLTAKDEMSNTTAQYISPTTRYPHGILGDRIEAGELLIIKNGKKYYYKLPETEVFEDLQPRLADVDKDGALEFITIRSSISQGASVAIYKIIDEKLQLFLASNFIGTPNRWLNIAAIDDLDNDGKIEIAWVQTPHIGGILRIFRVDNGRFMPVDEKNGVSNHRIGSKNLCLSVLTNDMNQKTLYLPTNAYDALIGFSLKENKIIEVDKIGKDINVSLPLSEQLNLKNKVVDANCIFKNE